MRTTVTLDPDLMDQLRAVAHSRKVSFKTALNDAVRAGLSGNRGERLPFKQITKPMGLRPGVDLTKALQMAADLEDEENIRKLELRK
jgi:hypothetical protein